jgi:O-antigen ligase
MTDETEATDADESTRPATASVETVGRLRNMVDSDRLLVASAALLIVSAAFSAYDAPSVLAGAIGIVCAGPAAVSARRHPVTQAFFVLGVVWVVYGFAVGAMPSLGDRAAISDWVSTEGRALVVIGVGAAMCGLQRPATFTMLLRAVITIVASVSGLTAALYVAGVDAVRGGNLLHGFTTSHHVPGFLACAGMIMLIVRPGVVPNPLVRAVALAAMFGAAVLSGSRTSILAVMICAAVVVARRRSIRSLIAPALIGVVVVGLALAGSSRLRETVEIVTSAEFYSSAGESFSTGDSIRAIELSSSEAEANMLIRFSIWGRTVDQFVESPIIGIGRYRVNDEAPTSSGVKGVVYLVTDAERLHTDAQPHNQFLYLLAETGVLGLALGLLPFWRAWRLTAPLDGRPGERDRMLSRLGMLFGGLVGLVSAGMLGTGVGLIGMMMVFGGARAWELGANDEADESAAAA